MVSARRIRSNNAVPSRPAGVYSISYFGFLKDAQVHVGLGHPPQIRLQSPVSSFPNIIGPKPNQHPHPCRIPSTMTHPPPKDTFLSPDTAVLPTCACLPLLPFQFPFRHRRPSLYVTVSIPIPVIPSPPTLCRLPWNRILCSALTPGQVALRRGYHGC